MTPRASLASTRRYPTAEKTRSDLFLAHLKDIYYAEKKIYRTLPTMVKAANDAELKKAFTTHREEPRAKSSALNRYSR
jgi:ferritin-like metal-binding protein YciE